MARSGRTESSDGSAGRLTRLLRTLVVLAVLAVAAYFGVQWAQGNIDDMETETTEVQVESAGLQAEVERYLGLEEIRAELEAQFVAAQASLPRTADLPGILDALVALSQSSGARLLSVVPSPPVPVTSPGADPAMQREVPIDIKVAGTEESMVRFVDGLRRLDRVIVVDSVNLRWPGNELRAEYASELPPQPQAEASQSEEGDDGSAAAEDPAVEDELAAIVDHLASGEDEPVATGLAQLLAPYDLAVLLDTDLEVVAELQARAFVWALGASVDRDAAEAIAGVGPAVTPAEEAVDGGG